MGTFILVVALIIFSWRVLYLNNVIGMGRGTKKAKIDTGAAKSLEAKIVRRRKFYADMRKLSEGFGRTMSPYMKTEYERSISRLGLKLKLLNREILPQELRGLLILIQLTGLLLTLVTFAFTFSLWSIIFVPLLFAPMLFKGYAGMRINEEDTQLEHDFPDFYMAIYNQLIRGSGARLEPTLDAYMESVTLYPREKKAMITFISELKGFIDVYAVDLKAVRKLRERYNSVMVVNFCNLAVQALNGVDNRDKLLAFKLELIQRQKDERDKRAHRLVTHATVRTYLVYVILAQVIVISWWSKMGGSLGSILNIFGM